MCTSGKDTYKCQRAAVDYNKGYGRVHGIFQNVYKCSECGLWHLSSRSKKGKKVKRIY